MREATSRVVLAELFERGATVTAYDPVAMEEARRIFGNDAHLSYADSPNAALQGADALIIVISEETGKISIAERGQLKRGLTVSDLRRTLSEGMTKVELDDRPTGDDTEPVTKADTEPSEKTKS